MTNDEISIYETRTLEILLMLVDAIYNYEITHIKNKILYLYYNKNNLAKR
jgi:hypothetical protein